MTHDEFRNELRRHLIAIVRACIVYYGWGWADFAPRETVKQPSKTDVLVIG